MLINNRSLIQAGRRLQGTVHRGDIGRFIVGDRVVHVAIVHMAYLVFIGGLKANRWVRHVQGSIVR